MPFRVGSKIGYTMYWSDPDNVRKDRFIGTAMSTEMAKLIVDALNRSTQVGARDDIISRLPMVERKGYMTPEVGPDWRGSSD